MRRNIRICSVDPGYDRIGVAILEKDDEGKETLLYSTCVTTKKRDSYSDRIYDMAEQVEHIITTYKPTVLAIEQLYFSNNHKTAIAVAGARGVLIYLAAKASMEVCECTPSQVKQAVTGYGRATKQQIMDMVPRIISLPEPVTSDDEMDAIAIGIATLAHLRV